MAFLVRWLSRRPLWLLHWLGALLGWAAYLLSPSYRNRFRAQAAAKSIRLQQRAWPLLEMMKRSLAAKKDIVWGV